MALKKRGHAQKQWVKDASKHARQAWSLAVISYSDIELALNSIIKIIYYS